MNLPFFILGCLTCSKAFQHAGGNAAGLAILLMLVVVVAMAGGIVFLLIRMARRESASLDPRYCDDYQPEQSSQS